MSTAKSVMEVKSILKDLKKNKSIAPAKEKPILEWTASELRGYIVKETKGMGIAKKLKFARELDARIKSERNKNRK
jgi:hypothetical protein